MINGVTVYTRADARKRHALHIAKSREIQGTLVAGGQHLWLTLSAPVPHGTHGVNNMPSREAIALGNLGVTWIATAKESTLVKQIWPRSAVNRTVNATAPQ